MSTSTDNEGAAAFSDIRAEIDEPSPGTRITPATMPVAKIPEKRVKTLEEQKFEHGTKIDRWATCILIGCIAALIGIYVFERIVGHLWYDQTQDLSDSNLSGIVVETLKFLISSLIGFLFAKRMIQ